MKRRGNGEREWSKNGREWQGSEMNITWRKSKVKIGAERK
jgi:hypothetical protein